MKYFCDAFRVMRSKQKRKVRLEPLGIPINQNITANLFDPAIFQQHHVPPAVQHVNPLMPIGMNPLMMNPLCFYWPLQYYSPPGWQQPHHNLHRVIINLTLGCNSNTTSISRIHGSQKSTAPEYQ